MFLLEDYEILHGLGEGGSGCTVKVKDKKDNIYAMKIMRVEDEQSIYHETRIASSFPSIIPFTLTVHGVINIVFKDIPSLYITNMEIHCKKMFERWFKEDFKRNSNYIFILMDLIEGDTLYQSKLKISNKFIVEFIFGLVYVLLKLHESIGFTHGDLTPHNIIMKRVSNIQSIPLDYGFRYSKGTPVIPVMIDFDRSSTTDIPLPPDVFGTFYISSPDILIQFIFDGVMTSRSVFGDIWAVGMNVLLLMYPGLILTNSSPTNRSEITFDAEFGMEYEDQIAENEYDYTEDRYYTNWSILMLYRGLLISESFNGPTKYYKLSIQSPLRKHYKKLMKMYNETKEGHPLLGIRTTLSNRLDDETLDLLGQMFSLEHKPDLLQQRAFEKYIK